MSAEILSLSEGELNERIARARVEQRLKRKRDFLTAIERGETPLKNPFEFDDTAETERPSQRTRVEEKPKSNRSAPALLLKNEKYYTVTTFIFDWQTEFDTHPEDYPTDIKRVGAVTAVPKEHIKDRWMSFIIYKKGGSVLNVTWDETKAWLLRGIADEG
jgi:hypothetical protein